MSVAELAQVLAAVSITIGAGFWGGQVRVMLRELKEVTSDHEGRLRHLERAPKH